jgi:glycosyltransferase involved in cell wall biosynthesis
MEATFSINLIICTYNNAALLDRVLAKIANQKVSPKCSWKVLVVDNNCTDETATVVQKYIQDGTIPDLRIILETLQGLNHARLCGVRNTTGDWIAFIDDDCLLEEDWIEQVAKFALAHPDCGAFGGRVILDWEKQPPAYVLKYGYSFAQQEYGAEAKLMNGLVGAGMTIRRSALQATGWMNNQFMSDRVGKKLISGGDVELALRLGAKYELWYNPACTLQHIIPARRITTEYLIKINYGLGISQIFGDSMVWPKSYLKWFFASFHDTIRSSGVAALNLVGAFAGRRSIRDAVIGGSFVCGRWAGIWRMYWMHPQERKVLVGCAKKAENKESPEICPV